MAYRNDLEAAMAREEALKEKIKRLKNKKPLRTKFVALMKSYAVKIILSIIGGYMVFIILFVGTLFLINSYNACINQHEAKALIKTEKAKVILERRNEMCERYAKVNGCDRGAHFYGKTIGYIQLECHCANKKGGLKRYYLMPPQGEEE